MNNLPIVAVLRPCQTLITGLLSTLCKVLHSLGDPVLHGLLVHGTKINVGVVGCLVAGGSWLDGRDDGGVTRGGGVDRRQAWMSSIAMRVPCKCHVLLQSGSSPRQDTNTNTCATAIHKQKCQIFLE